MPILTMKAWIRSALNKGDISRAAVKEMENYISVLSDEVRLQ